MNSVILAITLSLTSAAPVPDTAVVCPEQFQEAMAPWVKHRSEQGHQIVWIDNKLSAEKLRGEIRRLAKSGRLRNVLLVGDAEPNVNRDADMRARTVPTRLVKAKVNVRWGSEPYIATDNWYADVDDDSLPDLAVGRLTADSKDELANIVRKILAYESSHDFGPWRRRVNFIAGVGGFGKLADSVLESATKKLITASLPTPYQVSMTHASWRSAYFPNPLQFRQTTLNRFNEGCLFWVYIGHGQRHYLDHVYAPGNRHFPILSTTDVDHLRAEKGPPIAVFLACYTGAFDDPKDCLAEEMLRSRGGPVAVFSGSRVTMPYAMAVMSHELLDQYFNRRCKTLGQLTLNAKRCMATSDKSRNATSIRRMIEAVAAAVSPSRNMLNEERYEHLSLFNLLGDPLLRLYHPEELKIAAANEAYEGESLEIQLQSPISGRCTVELVCRRDRLRDSAPYRPQFQMTAAALENYQRTYAQANDKRWHVEHRNIDAGANTLTLRIPADAHGSSHVRAYVEGQNGAALGAMDVFIRPQRTDAAE